MFFEKAKVFITKHKIVFSIAFGITIAVLCFFAIKLFYKEIFTDFSDTTKGIVGTLLGAVVGGSFSLLGSIIVNNKTQKAQNAIKRNNIVFKPLYDELMDIHYNILVENPFPHFIRYEKCTQTELKQPQYTVWGRIKNDARFFEVPKKLRKALDGLYLSIEEYQKNRQAAVVSLDRIYKEEIYSIAGIVPDGVSIGDTLLSYVMTGERPDNNLLAWFRKDIQEDVLNELWVQLSMQTDKDKNLIELKMSQRKWNQDEEYVLDLLASYIQYITLKYEG